MVESNNVSAFVLSILGVAFVLVIGLIILGQFRSNIGTQCQPWITADTNGTYACQHYECVNNTHQTVATAYTLNSTRVNCYNATAYGVANDTQLTATVSGAYNATAGIQSNLSSVPNWIGILITVALAFIVLGYFYNR